MTTVTEFPGTVARLTVGMDYASQGEVWRVIEMESLPTGNTRVRGELLTGDHAGNTFDWYGTNETPVTLVAEEMDETDLRVYAHNVLAVGHEVIWAELVDDGQAAYIADWIGQHTGWPIHYYRSTQDTPDGPADTWEFWPSAW